jgi:subtilase family serine protease
VGSLPPEQRRNVSFVLALRKESELASLLGRLHDPSSPDYRHFLSVDQFTAQFAPTVEDYQAVIDFAHGNGFTLTSTPANRLIVPIGMHGITG